jgi:hypothetical protein
MTDQMTCDDCDAVVELHKADIGVLKLACDCGHQRSVRVRRMLPAGWSA